MKKNTTTSIQRISLIISICFLSFSIIPICYGQSPQNWLKIGEKSTNFYEIKNAFMRDNATKLTNLLANKADTLLKDIGEESEENRDLIKYQRWADWYEPRVFESKGDLTVIAQKEYEARTNKSKGDRIDATALNNASWTLLGPVNQTNSMSGSGRVNNIRIDPTNSNILYACTPASQLFKSINGGTSWTSISNGILATGVTDVAIDPTAPNTLYAVTGDGDHALYNPYSAGVFKSTDGGTTWSTTGLSYAQNYTGLTSIVINPMTPNIIMVGGTDGIHRSTDGGTSFTNTSSKTTRDLVFNPSNPSIVFAGSKSGGTFLRSADGGATWKQITAGLPASGAKRYAIDVSPANPNYVYAMATDSIYDNLLGFYRSTDGGLTFTSMSTTPNIPGGQGWYNLAVAADPLSANTVYAAGIDIFKSIDGGINWTNLTNVYTTPAANTHSDVHDLTFAGTSTLYITNDGGVYKTTNAGSSWSNISSNLSIAQPYGIGLSATNAKLIISGYQDNGTNLTSDLVNWKQVFDGDGMISFIDRTNDSIMYGSTQNGGLLKSTNGGTSFSLFINGFSGGYWVTPYIQDPVTANIVYAGGDKVYKSTAGADWTAISPSFSSVRWIDIVRNNNQIIYALKYSTLSKTVDGGANWTDLPNNLPQGGMLHVHIDVNDPNTVYVSMASYSGNSVYRSTDAGASWAPWSTGLPNLPANTIVTQIGNPGEVYCGTDLGVYYRNSSATSWTAFTTNLPPIPVRDLKIFYPTGKLRAATFGRGIWESPLNVLPSCTSYTTNTVYVNALATGTNNGKNWTNAFTNLQSALDTARSCSIITQIWVASGTYLPTTTNRNINFSMVNGVSIYGGFPNTGSPTFAQRNLSTNITTLSGDIGVLNNNSDNSYHIISNPAGLSNTAILDGFVIANGNANGTGTNNSGGGMINNSGTSPSLCSPTINNCIFKNNSASTNGGAVFNSAVGGNSNPLFTNCVFQNNTAVNGGAVYSDGSMSGTSSPVFINCSFYNNSGTTNGSILYNLCTSGTCLPDFKNCIFWNNGGSKTFFNNTATVTASYSFFEPTVTNYTNVTGNLNNTISPFVSVTDMHLNPCTAAINTGSNSANSSSTDLDGNLRKFGVIDMGAYEYQSSQVTVPTGTSNQTICKSTNASLSATCATGAIKWYNVAGTTLLFTGSPFNVTNLTTNIVYKVRCDDGTCTSSFLNDSVSVNPIPPIPNVQSNTTIVVGENITLTSTGCSSSGSNYAQWYKSADSSLVTMPVSPTVITNYFAKCIETTNSVACAGAKSGDVKVSIGDIISIITGNWENGSIWNVGRVPFSTDFVLIGANHTVTVTTGGATAKKVLFRSNAKINLGNSAAKLKLGN